MSKEVELIQGVGAAVVQSMLDLIEAEKFVPDGFSVKCMDQSFTLKPEAGECAGKWYVRVQREPFDGDE